MESKEKQLLSAIGRVDVEQVESLIQPQEEGFDELAAYLSQKCY